MGSFVQTVEVDGVAPASQAQSLVTLQKSSSGAQEIAFSTYKEVYLNFKTACKWVVAATKALAETAISAGNCTKAESGDYFTAYPEAGKSIWVLNAIDSAVAEAINVIKYVY